jgi:transcription initiation factor TFIID subunit 13
MNLTSTLVVHSSLRNVAAMSYPQYTPPGNQPPPTSTTYPYGTYHPPPHVGYGLPQTSGSYPSPYQTPGTYQTGVTSYGWTYPYSYVPQHPHSTHAPRPPVQTSATGTAQSTSTLNPPPVQQRSTTFTSYTPSYMRDSAAAAATGGATGRGSRKQSNIKGLFSKEREFKTTWTLHNWLRSAYIVSSEEPDVWIRR